MSASHLVWNDRLRGALPLMTARLLASIGDENATLPTGSAFMSDFDPAIGESVPGQPILSWSVSAAPSSFTAMDLSA
jgi:hypothetical protein